MRRIAPVVLAAAAFLLPAGCAHAPKGGTAAPTKKTSPQAKKQFDQVRAEIHSAFEAIPKSYGADPAGELEKIGLATKRMEAAEAALTPDLKGLATYPTLTTNLAALKRKIQEATLIQHCSAARRRILEAHHAGHKASAAELKALTDAVAALDAFEPKAEKDVVAPWKSELARLDEENGKIVPLRTQIPGPPRTPPEQARYDAKMATASAAANNALAALVTDAKKPGALPAADLTALATAAGQVKSVDPKAARYYLHRLEAFRLVSDLRQASPEGAKALADRLGGTVTHSGTTRGRRLRVRLKGEKDTCYTLFAPAGTRFRRMRAAGAHDYAIEDATYDGLAAAGLCLMGAAPVRLEATTARKAPYVVVAIPRAKMPLFLVTYLALNPGDPCNLAQWKDEWLDPIPGTVVWGGGEPYLVTKVSPPAQKIVGLTTTSGGHVRATKLQLVDDAPPTVKYATPVLFPGCEGSRARPGIDKAYTAAVREIRQAWSAHPIRAPFDRAGEMYDHGRAWIDGHSPDAKAKKAAAPAKQAPKK